MFSEFNSCPLSNISGVIGEGTSSLASLLRKYFLSAIGLLFAIRTTFWMRNSND